MTKKKKKCERQAPLRWDFDLVPVEPYCPVDVFGLFGRHGMLPGQLVVVDREKDQRVARQQLENLNRIAETYGLKTPLEARIDFVMLAFCLAEEFVEGFAQRALRPKAGRPRKADPATGGYALLRAAEPLLREGKSQAAAIKELRKRPPWKAIPAKTLENRLSKMSELRAVLGCPEN